MNGVTFRLFISSTFEDFRVEREILHSEIFPKIESYLKNLNKNYIFLPIDLRWGINDEAGLDHKTMQICLNQVRACNGTSKAKFFDTLWG